MELIRRIYLTACVIVAVGMVLPAVHAGVSVAKVKARAVDNTEPTRSNSAHLECIKTLRKLTALRRSVDRAIRSDDISAMLRLHREIQLGIIDVRATMDRALLNGAWNGREIKKVASEIIGQLEGARILNFISVAALTGYDHPTKKIPDSVKDATARLFSELEDLNDRVSAINEQVIATVSRQESR